MKCFELCKIKGFIQTIASYRICIIKVTDYDNTQHNSILCTRNPNLRGLDEVTERLLLFHLTDGNYKTSTLNITKYDNIKYQVSLFVSYQRQFTQY